MALSQLCRYAHLHLRVFAPGEREALGVAERGVRVHGPHLTEQKKRSDTRVTHARTHSRTHAHTHCGRASDRQGVGRPR